MRLLGNSGTKYGGSRRVNLNNNNNNKYCYSLTVSSNSTDVHRKTDVIARETLMATHIAMIRDNG